MVENICEMLKESVFRVLTFAMKFWQSEWKGVILTIFLFYFRSLNNGERNYAIYNYPDIEIASMLQFLPPPPLEQKKNKEKLSALCRSTRKYSTRGNIAIYVTLFPLPIVPIPIRRTRENIGHLSRD